MSKDLFLDWVALPCKVSAAFGYMVVIPTGFLLHEEIFLLIAKRSSVLPGEHKKPTHVINAGDGGGGWFSSLTSTRLMLLNLKPFGNREKEV